MQTKANSPRMRIKSEAAAAKSRQSCPTLWDPIDGSPSGSPVPGILQARTLEWVAISFSNAWKWKVKVKSLSRVQLSATAAYQVPPSMGFSKQEYWSGLPLPSPNQQGLELHKTIIVKQLSVYCWQRQRNNYIDLQREESVHNRERQRHRMEEVWKRSLESLRWTGIIQNNQVCCGEHFS